MVPRSGSVVGLQKKIDKNGLNLYLNLVGTYVYLVQKSSIEMSFKNLFTV